MNHIDALTHASSTISQFEAAADAVVTGDIVTLEALLRESPELVRARSTREHRATLLHYVAANGVEDYRQETPKNAVLMAEMLLKAGAEVDAFADAYGARQTTLNLLVSSVHPARAGVQVALVDTLVDFGAAVNGPDGTGPPLLTALAFHYAEAAEALVRRGARVDTIIAAAALGREELVESFIDTENHSGCDANLRLALVSAAMHRRTRVAELLLRKGVDPGAADKRGWTAMHWAAYYAYADVVQLLIAWKAPLEAENEFGGTPLNQTIWTTVHERLLPDHILVIQTLINAGSKLDRRSLDYDAPPAVAELLRRNT